jgi:succinate-semialdehyde dehydrogenase / glutarate-semialdehyde dehydrogenase
VRTIQLKDPTLLAAQSYIDGAWCDADSGATFTVDNPADGDVVATVANCGEAETRRAIDAANSAVHDLGGRFYAPTLLGNVPVSAKISHHETFGPVAPLIKFASDADAVQLANDTEFGLAAYFYSRDVSRIFKVAEALETGMVGINTGIFSNEVAPFGGIKQSGLGREGSKYGIEDYVEIKYLCLSI